MFSFLFACVLSLFVYPSLCVVGYEKNITNFLDNSEFYTEEMDFSGVFPLLETINIDATRKKRVNLDLSGSYPLLKNITYEGTFGVLTLLATGDFPMLETMSLCCSSCRMSLDFSGKWSKDTVIKIRNSDENIQLIIPADVGVMIHTATSFKGKVSAGKGFIKSRGGWKNKKFVSQNYSDSSIKLFFDVRTGGKGNIILIRN